MTDRGSSWIGPAVIAAVINNTGNIRLAFVYPVIMLLLPIVALHWVNFDTAEAEAKAYARLHTTALLASRGTLSVVAAGGKGGAESEGVALVAAGARSSGGGVDERALDTAGSGTPSP